MSATLQRDQVASLAKTTPKCALEKARKIKEPWFRAQALSWATRFTDDDPVSHAAEAARAAPACKDDYEKSAVRAWEIAALAEQGRTIAARKSLREALARAKSVQPISSRSEALTLLLQAAFKVGREEASMVYELLRTSCPPDEHWRWKRAIRDCGKMILGDLEPRPLFLVIEREAGGPSNGSFPLHAQANQTSLTVPYRRGPFIRPLRVWNGSSFR